MKIVEMKKMVLAASILLASICGKAQNNITKENIRSTVGWEKIGSLKTCCGNEESEKDIYYISKAPSVKDKSGYKEHWVKIFYNTFFNMLTNVTYHDVVSIEKYQVDCENRRVRMIQDIVYDSKNKVILNELGSEAEYDYIHYTDFLNHDVGPASIISNQVCKN